MHVFPAALATGLLVLTLAGCSSLPDRGQLWSRSGDFFSQSAEVLKAQRTRLTNFAGSLVGSNDDAARDNEVQTLFAQPYIDPLSRYIEERSGDDRFAAQLARVAAERSRRCAAISATYARRAATSANLQRMRRGYLYSCPAEVRLFASRVGGASRQETPAPPDTAQRTPRDAWRQETPAAAPADLSTAGQADTGLEEALTRRQHSDCYLLFTIRNNSRALAACQPLAAAGDARAQHHMARLSLMRNDAAGAAQWARRSAAQGHAPGQLLLGQLYQQGRGVAQEPVRGHSLVKSAADQGLTEAAYHTGRSYMNGIGVKADAELAAGYLEQAASGGHLPAYLALAELNANSAPQRYRYWMDQAARRGSARAQFLLGESYARAIHGPADDEAAYVWYSLALLNGHDAARAGIERQEERLTSDQLATARARIEDGINGRWY